MSISITPNVDAFHRQVQAIIRAHWKLFLFQGVLMLVLGMLAVALPNVSTLEIELLVGWLFIIGGFFRAAAIVTKRDMPRLLVVATRWCGRHGAWCNIDRPPAAGRDYAHDRNDGVLCY
jgi:Short repeat of unknown function (DUF308)